MNQINLTIGGRSFAIAVQPGDEPHVESLGNLINTKFQELTPRFSQNLLFAALQIADDLHRAQAETEKIRSESAGSFERVADMKREADLAVGQLDKARARIEELETELDQLQSSSQMEANKYNDLMADNERFKVAVMEADAVRSRLEGTIAELQRERDELAAELDRRDDEPGTASFINPAARPDDPDLAPSLERFAELLENCAAKLEGVEETS